MSSTMQAVGRTQRLRRAVVAATAAMLLAPLALVQGQSPGAALGAQRSTERGVTVSVRPLDVSTAARSWVFEIVLDTHSGDLSDDLAKAAVLVDDRGAEHRPAGWEGAAPGGHHRKGTLAFSPLAPRPGAVELRIQRTGEPAPRAFRWRLE